MENIVNKVLRDLIDDPENLAAFLYGSRVEGFSNIYSDLDVCVITKTRKDTTYNKIDEIDINIDYIPLSEFETLIDEIEKRFYDYITILWCHRIKVGIPVSGKDIFKKLKEKIDFHYVSKKLIRFYSGQALAYLTDSIGSFKSGDYETSLITARLAVELATMAYLASFGILNPKVKWIYRYLLNISSANGDEVREFKDLERMCAREFEEIERYITDATSFVNKLITEAQKSL